MAKLSSKFEEVLKLDGFDVVNRVASTKEDVMTLHELEQTISKLPPAELLKFREWFLRFDGDRWD